MKYLLLTLTIFVFIINEIVAQNCTQCNGTTNNGTYSTTIGQFTVSSGNSSFASGYKSKAKANYTTAIGFYSSATGSSSIAIGSTVKATGQDSFIIGKGGPWNESIYMENNIPRSLMIGFDSKFPTLFISESEGMPFYDKTGKVAIGNMTNPQAKLHLKADNGEEAAILVEPYSWGAAGTQQASIFLGSSSYGITSDFLEGLKFKSSGNYTFNDGFLKLGMGATLGFVLTCTDPAGTAKWVKAPSSPWLSTIIGDIYYNSGNVGIGTDNTGGYKLAVNGDINAKLLKISENVPSSDYVFEEDYKLMPLFELEEFVSTNKHLPEVKSAEEFKKEGYNVGDLDDVLLRKVEELTLYTIDQQKQIEKQQQLVDVLMDQVLELKQQLATKSN